MVNAERNCWYSVEAGRLDWGLAAGFEDGAVRIWEMATLTALLSF